MKNQGWADRDEAEEEPPSPAAGSTAQIKRLSVE